MPTRTSGHPRADAPGVGQHADVEAPHADAGAAVDTDPLSAPASDAPMDRLARRVLGLRDAEPRALMDLQGSLVLSAVRCIISYVVVPILLPLAAWADVVATPVDLVLSVLAILLAVRSLRRVWQANWTHRWAYTGFIAVVVVLLAVSVVFDVNALLG